MRPDAQRSRSNFRAAALSLLALGVLVPLSASAQMIPPHPRLRDFEPMGEYVLQVGGVVLPDVQMFKSDKAGSVMLLTGRSLRSSLLVMPRERAVERVAPTKVVVNPDNTGAFVLADAVLEKESDFTVQGFEVVFTLDGKPARLKEKPYLLGPHTGSDIVAHDVTYSYRGKKYQPSPLVVRALRQAVQPIRVRVFFGSWCPHCQEILPRILRVADALNGSSLRFDYYGLPSGFGDEPEAKRMGIDGVPTGIVYRGTREVGRISGNDWLIPELAIKKVLDNSAPKASR